MLSSYEAEENYYYFKNKCENALIDRQETKSSITQCECDKLNFDKRIKDLEKIIEMLERNNPFTGISFSIDNANKLAIETDDSFKECIKSNDLACANLNDVFKTKSVTEDINSNNALIEFKNEKQRLEDAIDNLNRKIDNLALDIDNLTHFINNCCYEMSYNKKYMF